ncbi:phosphatidylinositol-glycan biosynthesis class X protein [Pimephales promelas]|nr:phosphatidylinositol-glycan biosynthesis class X protein [Pimephales promelas]KAG1925502.1 phosphatidylinositol-glycan biosynthesis class X protein [Pimephales promelas]
MFMILLLWCYRDLLYTVEWGEVDHDVKALLVQKLPSGVYMDEYQLETLRHDTGLEVRLDSKVDLEAPEYLSTGFTALVFLSGKHEATVPVHGRYHRPADSGVERVTVELESPRLLVRSDKCTSAGEVQIHTVRWRTLAHVFLRYRRDAESCFSSP